MKNCLFIILILLFSSNIYAQIIEVSPDGTKDFTSIQAAVNSAPQNGAIIQVHPGTYNGTIRIREKSLTIQSLYATTQDTTYIHNTKLYNEYAECVLFIGGDNIWDPQHITVTIDGFTISNNLGGSEYIPDIQIYRGGGIYVNYANANIKNNIITNNLCINGGGGMTLSGHITSPRVVNLENNKIFNNRSLNTAGGISIGPGMDVVFSQLNRNSVFNNIGFLGKDIYIVHSLDNWQNITHIYLDKSSKILSEVDQNYIYVNKIRPNSIITIDIQQETLPPFVNHDLYVAPWGDDENSGLTSAEPLKTIHYATSIIASDQVNPKTIFLAQGTYSSENGQIFPVILPPYVNLFGSSVEETIIEKLIRNGIRVVGGKIPSIIQGFSIKNVLQSSDLDAHVLLFTNASLEDIVISNINTSLFSIMGTGATFNQVKNVIINNVRGKAIWLHETDNIVVENLIIDKIYDHPLGAVTLEFCPNAIVNNLSITNCFSRRSSTVFHVSHWLHNPPVIPGVTIMNNVLIANNDTGDDTGWGNNVAVVNIKRYHNKETILNNWTVAHNKSMAPRAISLSAEKNIINNMISYNPDLSNEINISSMDHINQVIINNSLIRDNKITVSYGQPAPILNNVIYDEPIFLGHMDDNITPDMWEYYFLQESSPAIDSGIDISDMMYEADLMGRPRIYGNAIDMGAFEYQGNNIDFTAEPRSGTAPLSVQFSCLSLDQAYAWEWDFDNDGIIDSTEQNPTFVYTEEGSYTVSLRINGEASITKPNFITVGTVNVDDEPIPPVLGFNLQNYPNPINLSRHAYTLISFDTKEKARTEPIVEIYNIKGQKIKTLNTGISFYDLAVRAGLTQENLDLIPTRNYSVTWNMRDENNKPVASGVYFYRAVIDGQVVGTNRLVVIK